MVVADNCGTPVVKRPRIHTSEHSGSMGMGVLDLRDAAEIRERAAWLRGGRLWILTAALTPATPTKMPEWQVSPIAKGPEEKEVQRRAEDGALAHLHHRTQ